MSTMTRSLFALLLAAATMNGCAKAPLATKVVAEQERVVHYASKPSTAKPVVAEIGEADPTRISHESSTGVGLLVSHSTSYGVVAPNKLLPGESPTLTVVHEPTRAFRAFPVFNTDTNVDSVKFSPADTKAEWTLTGKGSPAVGKVKVAVLDADGKEAATGELTAEDVGLDAKAGPDQTLALDPAGVPAILDFLRQNQKATRLTLKLTFEDPDGKPVLKDKTKPLELSLAMQVL